MTGEIYKALIGAELTHQEHAAASAIIRASAPQSVEQVSAATKLQLLFARRALRSLVGRKILRATQSGGSRIYTINEQVHDWR